MGITCGSSCIAEPTIRLYELPARFYRWCIRSDTGTHRNKIVLRGEWLRSLWIYTLGIIGERGGAGQVLTLVIMCSQK